MIPTWFIELALIFLFVIPILCLCLFFLISAEIMSNQEKRKEVSNEG